MPNLERQLPYLSEKIWTILKQSIGGISGCDGFSTQPCHGADLFILPFEGKSGDSNDAGENIFRSATRR